MTSLQARLVGLGVAAALGMGTLAAAPTSAFAEDDPNTPAEPLEQAVKVVPGEQEGATLADDAVQAEPGDGENASAEQDEDNGDDSADQASGDDGAQEGDVASAETAPGQASDDDAAPADEPAATAAASEGDPAPALASAPSDGQESSATEADDPQASQPEETQPEETQPEPDDPAPADEAVVEVEEAKETAASVCASQARSAARRAVADATTKDTDPSADKQDQEPTYPKNGWWTDPNDPSVTYFFKKGKRVRGWVVTQLAVGSNKRGETKRYWLDSSYTLARGRMVNPANKRDNLKRGYLAYARKDGSIATGTFRIGKRIYLANSNGRLAKLKDGKRRGWLVSSTYAGARRRYYLYRSTSGTDKGAYFAVRGFSRDGYAHYTLPKGYVLTKTKKIKGRIYLVSSKGRIGACKKDVARGWLVTSAFSPDGAQRRYYLYRDTDGRYKGAYYAKPGYSEDGYRHLTRTNGSVVCGLFRLNGKVFLATKKGRLGHLRSGADKGWYVNSALGQGKQRYYLYLSKSGITKGAYYAKPGLSSDGYLHMTTKDGYVARSCDVKAGGQLYAADKVGKLTKVLLPASIRRFNGYSSPTGYLILIDNKENHVYVLSGSRGAWRIAKSWPCCTGSPATPTVRGTYHVGYKGYSFGNGFTCYYWTQIYNDYLFHSVLYHAGTRVILDGTMGRNVSHGCVRLHIENAKWIYDYIPSGTTVVSY